MKNVFKRFIELSEVERLETPFILPRKELVALNIRNDKYDTIKFKGVTIINLWASWCKPCLKEIPSLVDLQRYRPETNISLVSFDSLNKIKMTFEKNAWDISAFYLTDTALFKKPKILPMTFILKNDTVIDVAYGYEDRNSIERKEYIDSIIKVVP